MPEESEKKKLIRVKAIHPSHCCGSEGYRNSQFNFAWVSNPETDRRQVSTLMTCREFVNCCIRAEVAGIDDHHYKPIEKVRLDLEKMRLMIVHDPQDFDKFRTRLFHGKAILNLIEERLGWEQSKITTVKHESYKNAWLITGPKEWMQNGPTMSIATLFLRIACRYGKGDELSSESFEELEKSINAFAEKERDKMSKGHTFDSDLAEHMNLLSNGVLRLYLENYKEIWKDVDIEDAYPKSADEFRPYNGIHTFLTQSRCSYSKKISGAMRKMFKIKKGTKKKEE